MEVCSYCTSASGLSACHESPLQRPQLCQGQLLGHHHAPAQKSVHDSTPTQLALQQIQPVLLLHSTDSHGLPCLSLAMHAQAACRGA